MSHFQRQAEPKRPPRRPAGRAVRRGSGGMTGLAAVLVLLAATGGGIWWWSQHNGEPTVGNYLLHTVARDDFELNITERGEIESFDVTEVRSQVKSNNTAGISILRIVPEGTQVDTGAFLGAAG